MQKKKHAQRASSTAQTLGYGLVLLMVLASLVYGNVSTPTTTTTTNTNQRTGLIVPLYQAPGYGWDLVSQAKLSNPLVSFIAIVNPSNGPGSFLDQSYTQGINSLRSAGVLVLGYVFTSWGSRPLSDVETEMSTYHSWYSLDGVFFDEVGTSQSYYASLTSYASSMGYALTVGNAGSPSNLNGIFSILNVYENSGLPSSSQLLHSSGQPISYVAYSVPSLPSQAFLSSLNQGIAYVFITDDSVPNPFDTLPSYFATEASLLR